MKTNQLHHTAPASNPHTRSTIRLVCITAIALAAALTTQACKRSPSSQGQPSSTNQGIDANTSRILQSMDEYAAQLQADKDAGTGEFAPQNDNDEPAPAPAPPITPNPDDQPTENTTPTGQPG